MNPIDIRSLSIGHDLSRSGLIIAHRRTSTLYGMRTLLLVIPFGLSTILCAQREPEVDVATLPGWIQTLLTDTPGKSPKPSTKPLHTNAFIGTWSMGTNTLRRFEFWVDAYRMVIREFNAKDELDRATLIDLQANVRLKVRWHKEQVGIEVEDLFIPQAGYFRELWNDTVAPTGKTRTILGRNCTELCGVDGNKDTTYYFTTDVHPKLFADLKVWAQWLCRDGDLQFLSAFSDRNAGSSLRVDWNKRQYGPAAGSMRFTAIKPGKTPMPPLALKGALTRESRMRWVNNSQLGRLPDWMRERVNSLPPDPLPVAFTPAAVDRGIPDNAFIGTLTAETPTRYVDEKRDTTLRIAKYSYWADARRAVLQLDDPDDEGTVIYMVDLDADVAIACVNEGHSYVIPKLYIGDLEKVGLHEFGRGLELDFTPTGQSREILGRKCEVFTTYERYLTYFWFSDEQVNPIFDMVRWLEKRTSQDFKDLMFFGVADRPMPFAVMGTYLTSYNPGKASPPVLDLSN